MWEGGMNLGSSFTGGSQEGCVAGVGLGSTISTSEDKTIHHETVFNVLLPREIFKREAF